jgi:ATP-binding cassette subfamily F protein uup
VSSSRTTGASSNACRDPDRRARSRQPAFVSTGNFARVSRSRKEAMLARRGAEQCARFDKFLAQEEVWVRQGNQGAANPQRGSRAAPGAVCGFERNQRGASGMGKGRRSRLDAGRPQRASSSLRSENMSARLSATRRWYATSRARVQRGDKIGHHRRRMVPARATLLRLILGDLAARHADRVALGTNLVQLAYYDQFRGSAR